MMTILFSFRGILEYFQEIKMYLDTSSMYPIIQWFTKYFQCKGKIQINYDSKKQIPTFVIF